MVNDILNTGGAFLPEFEVASPEVSEEEKEALLAAEEEIRQLQILAKSPAWTRIKAEFLAEIEKMKYEVVKQNDKGVSLENIGREFQIYRICEQKLISLIERVERGEIEDES